MEDRESSDEMNRLFSVVCTFHNPRSPDNKRTIVREFVAKNGEEAMEKVRAVLSEDSVVDHIWASPVTRKSYAVKKGRSPGHTKDAGVV